VTSLSSHFGVTPKYQYDRQNPEIIAIKVNPKQSLPKTDPVLYSLPQSLSRQEYLKGYSDEYFLVTASILANAVIDSTRILMSFSYGLLSKAVSYYC
jgi:hypothetical protein